VTIDAGGFAAGAGFDEPDGEPAGDFRD